MCFIIILHFCPGFTFKQPFNMTMATPVGNKSIIVTNKINQYHTRKVTKQYIRLPFHSKSFIHPNLSKCTEIDTLFVHETEKVLLLFTIDHVITVTIQ